MRYQKGETFGQRYGIDPTGVVLWVDQSDPRSYGDVANWYDLSGKGSHGVQAVGGSQPAITGADGLVGSCRDFDGTDYVDCGDKDIFSFGDSVDDTPFSICAWVYYRGTGGNGPSCPIVAKYRSYDPFQAEYGLSITNADKLTFQTLDSGASDRCRQDSTGTITKNRWSFVCVTYTGSSTDAGIKLYLDGVLMASAAKGDDGAYVAMHNRASELTIGVQNDQGIDTYSGFADALIACVLLLNRDLTAAEIQRMYLVDKPRYGGL